MKTYLILILFISSLLSCSQKKTVKKKVKVQAQIRMAAMAGYGGGGILIGTNGPDSFTKFLDSNTLSIELPNGLWDFMVIGWTGGDGNFSGNMLCDIKQAINLEGEEVSLPFTLASSKCESTVFGPHTIGYEGNGQPFPLTFNSCSNWLQMVADVGVSNVDPLTMTSVPFCDDSEGKEISFKLRMFQTPLSPDPWATKNNPIESTCQGDRTIGAGPMFTSNLRWPMISTGFAKVPIEIIAYDGANCSGMARVYQFTQGSGEFALGNEAIFSPASDKIGITLHSNLCEGSFLTNAPFANHTTNTFVGNKEYLICSTAQLQELAAKWDDFGGAGTGLKNFADISFRLGKNIDLSSGFSTPIGTATAPFNSKFKGSEFTLSNWTYTGSDVNAGIFGVVGDAEISDLNLHNIQMAPTSATLNVGILFGSLADVASYRTEISHITITRDNTAKSVDCNFCNNVGGLGGAVDITVGTRDVEIRDIDLSNIFVDGGDVGTASMDVGGVLGRFRADNQIHMRADHVSFSGTVEGNSHVAAFSSLMQNSELDGCTITANGTDYIQGKEFVAGVVAEAFGGNRVTKCEVNVVLKIEGTDGATTPPDRKFFGGVAGKVLGGDYSDITVTSNISSTLNDNTIYVGGIAGYDENAGCANITRYYNIQVDTVIQANGEQFGGAFGHFNCGEVRNILVDADVLKNTIHTANNEFRGLFAGYVNYHSSSSASKMILKGAVEGSATIGGIAGYSAGTFNEVFIADGSSVTSDHTNFSLGIAGGVIGQAASGSFVNNVVSHADVYYTNSGTILFGGKYFGKNYSSTPANNNGIILLGEIDEGAGGGDEGHLCFSLSTECSMISSNLVVGNTSFNSGAFISPYWSDDGAGNAELTFYKGWSLFDLTSVGNYINPFHIADCEGWNRIKNKEILMYKSYILDNDLDFSAAPCSGVFFPIGGGQAETMPNKFLGNIISNQKSINNISLTISVDVTAPLGLIRIVGDENSFIRPRIGDWREPLVLNNVTFTAGSNEVSAPFGIAAGMVESGDISVHVNGSSLDAICGTPPCDQGVGGVVGRVIEGVIDGSSFRDGTITLSGDYINVGGLIGLVYPTSMRSSWVSIYESMSEADITADENVGGIIGKISSGSNEANVSINDSYYFNANTDPLSVSGTYTGSLIGKVEQVLDPTPTARLEMRNCYAYANMSTGTVTAIGDAVNTYTAPTVEIMIDLGTNIFYSFEAANTVQTYTHGDDTIGTGSMMNYADLPSLYSAISNESTGLDQERFSLDPGTQRAKLWFEVDGYYHDDH